MAHTEITLPDGAESALTSSPIAPAPSHWTNKSADPNDQQAIADRAAILSAAWRPSVPNRSDFICSRVTGRRVLDIGCVAHDIERIKSPDWLHRRIAQTAESCLGLDVLDDGVAKMRALGFDVISHDLRNGPGPLRARGPFQVIVAGEVIEHVGSLDMLFETAASELTVDGELILTTPNPYAPARVRAGREGAVWENVDHIAYAFPSGVAELASRHGLVLTEAFTTEPARRVFPGPFTWLKRTIRKQHWHRRGFATTAGKVRPVRLDRRDALDWLQARLSAKASSKHQFLGETFIYVIQRDTLL